LHGFFSKEHIDGSPNGLEEKHREEAMKLEMNNMLKL